VQLVLVLMVPGQAVAVKQVRVAEHRAIAAVLVVLVQLQQLLALL
jgi:hypothetical protein